MYVNTVHAVKYGLTSETGGKEAFHQLAGTAFFKTFITFNSKRSEDTSRYVSLMPLHDFISRPLSVSTLLC